MKKRIRLLSVFFVAFFAVVLCAGWFWWGQNKAEVQENLRLLIIETAAEELNGRAEIDQLTIDFPPLVTLNGIRIFDAQGELVVDSPKAEVTIHYLPILLGRFDLRLLDTVTLTTPTVVAREREDRQWNLEQLLRKSEGSESMDLDMKIRISEGLVKIRRLENVSADVGLNGEFHLGDDQKISGAGEFVIQEDRAQFEFAWQKTEGRFKLEGSWLKLAHGALAWLPSQEPKLSDWQGALVNYRIEVIRQADGTWRGSGRGNLANAGLSVMDYQFSNWNGFMAGDSKNLTLQNIRGSINGEPLEIMGRVALEGDFPMDVTVRSRGFQIAKFRQPDIPPVEGVVQGEVRVTGSLSAPILDGELFANHLALEGRDLGKMRAFFKKESNTVQLTEVEGSIWNGTIRGKGKLDWETKEGDAQLDLESLNLSEVPTSILPEAILPIQGRVSGNLAIQGSSSDLIGNGELSFYNGRVGGVVLSSLSGEFKVRDEALAYVTGTAGVAGGWARFSGNGYSWDVVLDRLELAQIGPIQSVVVAQGPVSGSAAVNLTGDRWVGSAEVSGSGGQIAYQPYDEFIGRFSFGADGIARIQEARMVQRVYKAPYTGILEFEETEDGKVIVRDASNSSASIWPKEDLAPKEITRSHEVSGWFAMDGSNSRLTISSQNMRAESIVPFLPKGIFVSGNVNNEVIIEGSLFNPGVSGSVALVRGSVGTSKETSVLLDEISGTYQRENGAWSLRGFQAENWSMNFKADGQVTESGAYDLRLKEGSFDLARPLMWEWPYPVSGEVGFSGQIQGAGEGYRFEVSASAPKISANNQDLENVKIIAFGNEKQIEIPEVSFNQETGKFFFEGWASGENRSIFGDLRISDARLSTALPLVNLTVPELEGTLNGNVNVNARFPWRQARIVGRVTDGIFRRQKISKAEFDAGLENQVWKINEMTALIGDEGILIAEGGIDEKQNMEIQIAAKDIDASLLPDLVYQDWPLGGKLQIVSQIGGNLSSPEVALSAAIAAGNFGGTEFDKFHSLLILKDGQIRVEQMALQKGEYQASAYGTIPLSTVLEAENAREESMDLTLRLDNGNLAILPALNPVFLEASGETRGELKISGTLAEPRIIGEVAVRDGRILFNKVKKPLENIELEVDFSGDTFTVKEGSAKMGRGHVTLAGQGGLTGTSLMEYQASVRANRLEVESPYYKGEINGELNLASGVRRPMFSGEMNFSNVTITVPLTLMIQESQAVYLPTVGLDVKFNLGEKVRLYDPVFYDISPRGELRLRRTLQNPALEGYLEATSGRIWYFGNQFQVTDAKADFQTFQGLMPTMKLEAQHRLTNSLILLQGEGIAAQMQFDLSSEPTMSQEEIRNLLLFKTDQVDINSPEFSQQVASMGAMALLEMSLQSQRLFGLEKFAQENFGVDELQLAQVRFYNRSAEDAGRFEANYGVRVGKSLGERVYFSHILSMDEPSNGISTLRYDFNRYWNLSGELERYERENRYQMFLRGRF